MKKIAFYVEGQTEMLFINKLLIEIAGQKRIEIRLEQFKGANNPPQIIIARTQADPLTPQYYALIVDCTNDGGVKHRILENASTHFSEGFCEIIGLQDLYPLALNDLPRLESTLQAGTKKIQPLPVGTGIIVAVREIEEWFLKKCKHYACIDPTLALPTIIAGVGFNPCEDDLTTRNSSAADDLKSIYNLVGKGYSKSKTQVERTIECLDYANLYLIVRNKIAKLDALITKIDNFLT